MEVFILRHILCDTKLRPQTLFFCFKTGETVQKHDVLLTGFVILVFVRQLIICPVVVIRPCDKFENSFERDAAVISSSK